MDFQEIKARFLSYSQRLWVPVSDIYRTNSWTLGYIKNNTPYVLYRKEDLEYAAWVCNSMTEIVEEIERLEHRIKALQVEL